MKISDIRNNMKNIVADEKTGETMLMVFDGFRDSAMDNAQASKVCAKALESMTKGTKTYRETMGKKAIADSDKKSAMNDAQTLIDRVYLDAIFANCLSLSDAMKAWMADYFRPVLTIKASEDSKSSGYDFAPVSIDTIIIHARKLKLSIPDNLDTLWHDAMVSMYAWQVMGWGYEGNILKEKQEELQDLFENDDIDFATMATTGHMERAMQDIIDALFGLTDDQKKVIKFRKGYARRYNELDSKNKRVKSGSIEFANEATFISNWTYVMYELMTGNVFAITNTNK